MRIVIPEGAEFVQKPEHLDPLRRLGELVVSPGHPRDKADFIISATEIARIDAANRSARGAALAAHLGSRP